MVKLDDKTKSLLNGKNFAFVATLNKDGSPHLTPTWVDTDGEHILINTALGRKKTRNVIVDPRIAVSVFDHDNPYDAVSITGNVVKMIKGKRAEDHIDKLSYKYRGERIYKGRDPAVKRVILVIEPTKIY